MSEIHLRTKTFWDLVLVWIGNLLQFSMTPDSIKNRSRRERGSSRETAAENDTVDSPPHQALVGIDRAKENWHGKNRRIKRLRRIHEERQKNLIKSPHKQQSGEEGIDESTFASSIPEIVEVTKNFKDIIGNFPDFWTAVKSYDALKYDSVFGYVEGFLSLTTILSRADDTPTCVAALMLYVKTLIGKDKSLISAVGEYIEQLCVTPQDSDGSIVDALRECRMNWRLFRHNRLCKKVSTLITLIVSLGICDATRFEFSLGGLKVIEARTFEIQMGAMDIVDAIFDTLSFFIEGGIRCYSAGSLKPLLFDDYKVYELESEFITLSRMWDLQQSGNLLKLEGVPASEFDNRLESALTSMKSMLPSFSGLDKKILTDKYNKLLQIKSDYVLSRLAGGTRAAPWTIELFGKSNQGKTTVGKELVDRLLLSAGCPLDETRRATLNASSKFMDTWKTDSLVAILDDMCNEKSNFVETPPTRWVIDLCNNQVFCAPKAELENKGKVFVEPKIVLVNTNKKDLDAGIYSNCPYSVQRRCHLVATIKAKDQFQAMHGGVACGLSSEKVEQYYLTHDKPEVEDLWDIDVEVAIEPPKLSEVATYAPFMYEGKAMTGIGMNEFVELNIALFTKHLAQQAAILERSSVKRSIRVCGVDKCKNVFGQCSKHSDYKSLPSKPASETEVPKPETPDPIISTGFRGRFRTRKQWGEEIAAEIYNQKESAIKQFSAEASTVETLATKAMYLGLTNLSRSWDWLKFVPAPIYQYPFVEDLVKHFARDKIAQRTNEFLRGAFSLLFLISAMILKFDLSLYPLVVILWLITLYSAKNVYARVEREAFEQVRHRSQIMQPMLEKFKNDNYKMIVGITTVAFTALAIRNIYKSYKLIAPKQGNIESPTKADVVARDQEPNPYVEVTMRPVPIVGRGRTITPSNMTDKLKSNLLYCTIDRGEKKFCCNILMLHTNYCLIPTHYFEFGDIIMTARRNNPGSLGGSFDTRLDKCRSVPIPNADVSVAYISEGGSYADISDLFLEDYPLDHPFYFLYRKLDGSFIETSGRGKSNPKCNNSTVFHGFDYMSLGIETFGGLCGAVTYSAGIGCNVTGIHVGGVDGTPRGCASAVLRPQIEEAIKHLTSFLTCIKTASDTDFPKKQFGVEFMTNEPLHPKSPINFLPLGATIQYHGSCIGKTTSHTDAKKTIISDIVAEESGIENKWRGPMMRPEWKGWQECLANISEPGKPMPFELLEHCAKEYIGALLDIIDNSDYWKAMKPLNDEENLLGVPGEKFKDPLKKLTAIGYPLTGSKLKHLIALASTEKYPHNFKFTPEIMEEIEAAEQLYLQHLRAYPIAKGCKKDEILDKEKCRIFYGNSIVLTWLIRKYFLPLIRFLQMHPLVSECAVGINCHAPEWEQLYTFMSKHPNLIGGDYKKYDQKLPSQLIITAFKILIELAKQCDYTQDDITIMESMVADVVYAYIAMNGDLISLNGGTHISGNSLTVIVNGICGSLNLRAAFYSNNSWSMKYRDHVNIMTYGDDNLGSCSDDCKFSIKIIADYLAKYGQKYTMPNKSDTISDYLSKEDFEFLKRETVYIPEIDCHIGALQVDSIYKSLHMYLRGKGCEHSPEVACALNIDTAMREFFNHGREIYDHQQAIMKRIADKANLTNFCSELDVTFDNRVEMWRDKYLNESSDMTIKDQPRTIHGVVEEVEDIAELLVTDD